MNRVLTSVEGQTEEAVAVQLLQPHLEALGVHFQPVIVETKRLAAGNKVRGGLSTWKKAATDIRRLLRDSGAVMVTTMYDFYALPDDAPGMADRAAVPPGEERVTYVEAAIRTSIGHPRFEPYLSLHELEALVLAAPAEVLEQAAAASPAADVSPLLDLGSPELVDDNDPPSKRLLACWPGYAKPIDGPSILKAVGLPAIRDACPHFDAWLSRLENLAP